MTFLAPKDAEVFNPWNLYVKCYMQVCRLWAKSGGDFRHLRFKIKLHSFFPLTAELVMVLGLAFGMRLRTNIFWVVDRKYLYTPNSDASRAAIV